MIARCVVRRRSSGAIWAKPIETRIDPHAAPARYTETAVPHSRPGISSAIPYQAMTRSQLPLEIEVENLLSDGVRYVLPARKLGGLKLVGLALIAFGLFGMGFTVFWIIGAGGDFDDPFQIVFAAFGIPFLIAELVPLGLGAFVLYGHSEVRVGHGQLVDVERAFPFRWSWSRNIDEIERLSVSLDGVKVNNKPVTEGPLANLSTIAAKGGSRKPMLVAPGYPREWLRPLADELAHRCDAHSDSLFASSDESQIEVVEENFGPEGAAAPGTTRLEQPADSPVEVERFASGITLKVPPPGIRKGSRGLFGVGLVWTVFNGVFTGIVVAISFDDAEALWILLFLIPFWAIGIVMLLAAISMGRRSAVLAVVNGKLMILQTGLFGSKRREWDRADVQSILSGPTGTKVNDVPIMELQVADHQGRKFGALSGREPNELAWLAYELTEALHPAAQT